MRVRLHSCDKPRRSDSAIFPNYALMKIAAFWKTMGADVGWAHEGDDLTGTVVYASKVFTYSKIPTWLPEHTIYGGTGIDPKIVLPSNMENLTPDYTIYPEFNNNMGFLTRGCIRACADCVVPGKEGPIRPYMSLDSIVTRPGITDTLLMDNNVLAHEHGIQQIEAAVARKVKIDFNQGLDARLIDGPMSRLLSKVKWLSPLRMACDSVSMITAIRRAVTHLRWNNCTPSRYFIYVLVKDVPEALEVIKFLKGMNLDPFAQPFLDPNVQDPTPTSEQVSLARWANNRKFYRSKTFEEYLEDRIKEGKNGIKDTNTNVKNS